MFTTYYFAEVVQFNSLKLLIDIPGGAVGIGTYPFIPAIKRRFDTKNTRMLALALLCYGKAAADKNGECGFSLLAMSNWIGIDSANIISRYMPHMYTFNWISKIKPKYKWDKDQKDKMTHVKFEIPLVNEGRFKLEDNNITELFSRIF